MVTEDRGGFKSFAKNSMQAFRRRDFLGDLWPKALNRRGRRERAEGAENCLGSRFIANLGRIGGWEAYSLPADDSVILSE